MTRLRHIAAGLICAALAALATPALAGHFTHDAPIGFSTDGRYFAFKTYGIQRGSGLPFANVFVIDVDRDAWVSGSPFRVAMSEGDDIALIESAPYTALQTVRDQVMRDAAAMLAQLNIVQPATELFAAGMGELHAQPERIRIHRPHPDWPHREHWGSMELLLETVPASSPLDYCPEPEALAGYRLTRIDAQGTRGLIHEDASIPASRGCAEAYRLSRVLSRGYPGEGQTGIALISVFSFGFEGYDRGVIAVPVRLP